MSSLDPLSYSLRRSFAVGDRRALALLVGGLLLLPLIGAALVVGVHPAVAVALPLALVAAALLLRTPMWGLYGVIAVAVLLPFAALPFSIGFKPTFLDVMVGASFFVWFMTLLAGRARGLRFAPFSLLIVIFVAIALAAFVGGLQHAALDKQTLRRFVELLLGVGIFFVVVDYVRSREQLAALALLLMWCGFGSALIGILLYLLPHELSNQLLNQLTRFDYPGGFVLRFILDDPALNQRAISTSVDPNVFGGLLILLTAFTAPQIAAERPLLPRGLAILMTGTMGLALALTFSRGSMAGLVVALTPLILLRYRWLLPYAVVGVLLLLLLPQAQDYIGHFIAGVRGEDLATQMRFGEYKDALRLIQRYPWLGVGFSGAPDIDLYVGVSSVYLLIASQMGLIGLTAYLLVLAAFFLFVIGSLRRIRRRTTLAEPLLLGGASAIFGAAFAGIFDHHFFDVAFPHFATLFWLLMGVAVAARYVAMADHADSAAPHANPLSALWDGAV